MRKQIFLALALFAGGCLGSDPNENSQLYGDAAPPTTGTGGSGPGTGGSGSVTGPIKGSAYALFNTATEGFQLNVYHDTGAKNLGDPASGGETPTLTFDSSTGNPDPGCLKVVAPYTGPNQYVDIQKSMTTTPQDWSGKTLHVRIKVVDGTYPGGAQVYAITVPNQYVFGGTFTNVAKNNNWQEFTVNLDSPMTENAGYDPTQVIIVGVQLNTGSAGSTATTVTFNIDSFSIDPPLTGGTGTAGTTGTAGAGGRGGAGGGGGTGGTGGTGSDASAGN